MKTKIKYIFASSFPEILQKCLGLEEVIESYKYKPYFYYPVSPIYLKDLFMKSLQNKKRTFIVLEKDNKPIAFADFGFLPWDSKILQVKAGRIFNLIILEKKERIKLIDFLIEICKIFESENYDFIHIKVNYKEPTLAYFLEKIGFKFMSTVVIYSLKLTKIQNISYNVPEGVTIRELNKKDIPFLLNLAEIAFIEDELNLSRFYVDHNIPKEKVAKIYKEWLLNCISGMAADKVFVAVNKNIPIGFITCKILNPKYIDLTIGDVPLNAVAKKFRGKGIYKALVAKALKWFKIKKCDYVEIKTQLTTLAPQYIWQKYGGRLVNAEYHFHKWFKKT